MNKSSNALLVAVILIALVGVGAYTSAYTVKEHEQAVILAFGEVVGKPITEPGLHFKIPWYEARKFDKRWLAWDGDPNQITTLDKRYIVIDVFARWKIVDPLIFIEKLRDEQSAQGRLDDILDSATRNVIANHNLIEAIRSTNRQFKISEEERENLLKSYEDLEEELSENIPPAAAATVADTDSASDADSDTSSPMATESNTDSSLPDSHNAVAPVQPAPVQAAAIAGNGETEGDQEHQVNIYEIEFGRQHLTELIIEKASQKARELGIELKDVRLKRIDYIPSVQQSVFDRMISERHKVAARLRSQGDGLSAKILGRKDRDLKEIQSEAYRKAEEIRGKADATAARIYAEAYKRDPELYRFLKTLESYRRTISQKTWLILTTNSEYGSYLKSSK
ncbi:MAG: protease modulator HflC [Deltaproteobacteria bacterium]|nr:protease modulator HflC [Deltaproteobacteria bacterium]MBN2671736.1 protease modulator HflC [Deltaproteobacteria bacterium]